MDCATKKELLSREDALKLHHQMWTDMQRDLGNKPSRHARITYKYNWCKERGYRPLYNCFLCQYVMEQEDISGVKDPHCTKCPIDWPGGDCGSEECNFLVVPVEDILKLPEKE